MSNPVLSGLYRYPVKSLRGAGLAYATLDARGIRYDRHWMLVDPDGQNLIHSGSGKLQLGMDVEVLE